MSKWGRNDQAVTANSTTTKESSNGAPIGTYALVMRGGEVSGAPGSANAHYGNTSAGSRANVDSNMFGNVTMGAFIPNMAVGVFGVSPTMAGVIDGPIIDAQVNYHGTGYLSNAVVTVTAANGTTNVTVVNAHANATTGYIDSLKVATTTGTFKAGVTMTVAAPAAQTFNANTSLTSAQTINSNTSLFNLVSFNANTGVAVNGAITTNNQPYSLGDQVLYFTGSGQTAVTGLTNATNYYVVAVNSTAVYLGATVNGAAITLTKGLTATTGEFLERQNFVYTTGANPFSNGTVLLYTVAAGNTAIAPLTNATNYYVVTSNSIGFALSNTSSGPVINVVPGVTETGHTLTRSSFISIAGSVLQNGDRVTYANAAGNTAIVPLVNGNTYYVTRANTTGFFLAANQAQYVSGLYLALVAGASETGHSLKGQTATGNVTIGGGVNVQGVSHAGWVVRREGTGGRAGRVHYETLIAMGSLGAQSASYGTPALVANASGTSNSVFPSAN